MFLLVLFFGFFFFFFFSVVFCFFFALNSASTNEDIGRPCASAILALNQRKIISKFARKCGKSALSQ